MTKLHEKTVDSQAETNSLHSEAVPDEQAALQEQLRAQSLEIVKKLPALGPVIMLYLQSPHRRFHFLSDLEWLLLPPLVRNQCKLYTKEEFPISYASWAFLNAPAEKRLMANGGRLRPEDWSSGDKLWIIDIVAPFGGIETMLRDLRKNEFSGRTVHILVPDMEKGGYRARKFEPYDENEGAGKTEAED